MALRCVKTARLAMPCFFYPDEGEGGTPGPAGCNGGVPTRLRKLTRLRVSETPEEPREPKDSPGIGASRERVHYIGRRTDGNTAPFSSLDDCGMT